MYSITGDAILNWIITIIVFLITLYLVRFYIKVYQLPKGPFPYPLYGNSLFFKNQCLAIAKLKEKYGPIFTIWFANSPIVFVSDLKLIRQTFNDPKRNEFNGKPNNINKKLMNGYDVSTSDYGPVWVSLRRVGHSATRKLASSDKLLSLVNNAVNQTVDLIVNKEGVNKPFNPSNYLYLITFNTITSSMFGKSYTFDDPEFNYFKDSFIYFRQNLVTLDIVNHLPILKPFYYKTINNYRKSTQNHTIKLIKKYNEHLNDYKHGVIRDICDGLIEAKEESIKEEKESAKYLNDENLANVITNLFRTGNLALNNNMRWILLLMANNTEMQMKMREEINEMIGDRMATQNDKNKCIYVMAFIMECLRFRPAVPFGIFRRAMSDAKIDNHNIPEHTILTPFIWSVHHDPKHWPNPHVFDPNRFITSDGILINGKQLNAFMPFGIGKRVCIGRKFALENMFLITVRLLQSTSGFLIVLPNGNRTANLDPDPNLFLINTALPFEILLKPHIV